MKLNTETTVSPSNEIEQPLKCIWLKPEMTLSPISDITMGHQFGANVDASFFNS